MERLSYWIIAKSEAGASAKDSLKHEGQRMEYEEDDDYGEGDGPENDTEERLAEVERRVEELESRPTSDGGGEAGVSLGYVVGVSFAMILSWSRNASILWCLLHGFFSWFYVIYFALTR